MGPGIYPELLTAMATGNDPNPQPGDNGFYFEPVCGQFYPAGSSADLDEIMTQILVVARSCQEGDGKKAFLPVILSH
jgi:hypothetical protein